MINTINLAELKSEFGQELKSILNFWSQNSVDKQHGGFIGQITHQGELNPEASKGVVLNARLLWTFSVAARMLKDADLIALADRAFEYLGTYFWDHEKGGLFWELDCNGKPINTRKQAYAQGFGIYAFAEYYLATGNEDSLQLAKRLFDILETHFADPLHGGYIEALDRNWQPLEDMRLSERDANFPKSMNTHLHILEPYTNLYRAWPNAQLKKRVQYLLQIFSEKIVDQDTGHFNLFFEMDWTCKSKIVSFGHDIEGAWLLHEAAVVAGDQQMRTNIQEVALGLVEATLKEGFDTDGSVFNERKGTHLDTTKHWWMQAEAMVGLMDAFQITGEERYLETMEKVWCFIKKHVIDKENGEWFGHVDRLGKALDTEDKAGFWKCPYHNSRAMIELINRSEKLT